MLVYLFFNYQSARMGKDFLAANTAALNVMMLMTYAQDGFNNVAEILVGNSLGAKDIPYFWQSIKSTCWYSVWGGIIAAIIYLVVGKYLLLAITSIPHVLNIAYQVLPWLIASPLIAIWCFWLDGVFMGAAWGRELRNGMMLSLISFSIVWYFARSYGNAGLWSAFLSFFVARGLVMGMLFYKKTRPFILKCI